MDSKVERLLNGKNLVFLATTMADGSPQVTPVWGNFADSYILINTAEGRIKHKNILRDPRVAISVVDVKNPLDMTSIRGEVVEILPDYEYKHADFLTKQYMGKEKYPFKQLDEKRITLKIEPKKIFVLPELSMSND
jgi:PPOX class probable F420-dependent enzyme|uniref:Pyridoxamine 5'-phosphate oxidase family protein n=1 Tax=uncultured marine thaumarchaeote KM3_69_B11 TaxID=1456244 RepID=A0A075HGB7_9ARCH|nr:pyridoxamine 5'-phosphate oxidase family protein [uncultured marine thaumarchaeote KM3_69_B11]|tara:strand:+ start:1175 stop:1582 length:408 start_codon:yes stop_codon:yes gene_type:complete